MTPLWRQQVLNIIIPKWSRQAGSQAVSKCTNNKNNNKKKNEIRKELETKEMNPRVTLYTVARWKIMMVNFKMPTLWKPMMMLLLAAAGWAVCWPPRRWRRRQRWGWWWGQTLMLMIPRMWLLQQHFINFYVVRKIKVFTTKTKTHCKSYLKNCKQLL